MMSMEPIVAPSLVLALLGHLATLRKQCVCLAPVGPAGDVVWQAMLTLVLMNPKKNKGAGRKVS